MADRPILFSGPMVRALLEGRKTQTRRVLKPQPPAGADLVGIYAPGLTAVFEVLTQRGPDYTVRLPYVPGDRLWVRETWAPLDRLTHSDPGVQALADRGFYRADRGTVDGEISRWSPAIHMPRWASRLTLFVVNVRVQRLQTIDEDDAMEEGCRPARWDGLTPRDSFHALWDGLNAERGFGWATDPWVVAVTFSPIHENIDQMQ
ncbi:MAG: hypothetical protein WBA42_07000 [Mesorhizobium sp.]